MVVDTSCKSGCGGLGSTGSTVITSIGGSVMAASPLTGPAAPIVAAVGALIALGGQIAGALHLGEGCGPTCVQATQVVNQAEPTFRLNLEGYETGVIDQSTAISNFNQMWTAIEQSCGAIPGTAGANCVGDRQSGACKWKQTGQSQYPGQPNIGECWNWWNAYHDPLEQPALVPYTSSVGGSVNNIMSGLTSNPMLMIGVGVVIVGMMMGEK